MLLCCLSSSKLPSTSPAQLLQRVFFYFTDSFSLLPLAMSSPIHRVAVLLGDPCNAEHQREANRLRLIEGKTDGAVTFEFFATFCDLRGALLQSHHTIVHFAGNCDGRFLWYRHDDTSTEPQ